MMLEYPVAGKIAGSDYAAAEYAVQQIY